MKNHNWVSIFAILCILLLSNTAHSSLISVDFTWVGADSYRAEGTFTYDDTYTLIQAEGQNYGDFNDGLDYLEISFFDPSNTPLYSAIDVFNGVVQYEYLQFNFNTSTMEFFNSFDMGEDTSSPGEFYLYGNIQDEDSYLFSIDVDDNIDQLFSPTIFTVTLSSSAVPEPNTMLLFGIGLLGVAGVGRRKK